MAQTPCCQLDQAPHHSIRVPPGSLCAWIARTAAALALAHAPQIWTAATAVAQAAILVPPLNWCFDELVFHLTTSSYTIGKVDLLSSASHKRPWFDFRAVSVHALSQESLRIIEVTLYCSAVISVATDGVELMGLGWNPIQHFTGKQDCIEVMLHGT